jgi:hypothetical protein
VIVHEAWHFSNGRQEAGAYGAQLSFLVANHAPDAQIAAVQLARDRVLAVARKAAKAAGRPEIRESCWRRSDTSYNRRSKRSVIPVSRITEGVLVLRTHRAGSA